MGGGVGGEQQPLDVRMRFVHLSLDEAVINSECHGSWVGEGGGAVMATRHPSSCSGRLSAVLSAVVLLSRLFLR